MRRRKVNNNSKTYFDSKFRSGLECDVDKQIRKAKVEYYYEEEWIGYTIPAQFKKYLPDFKIITKAGKAIYIEVKGLWDFADRQKHAYIKRQNPDLDIRFIFSDPAKKIRKGSKTTYADICEGRGRGIFKGLKWPYFKKKIPQRWFDE